MRPGIALSFAVALSAFEVLSHGVALAHLRAATGLGFRMDLFRDVALSTVTLTSASNHAELAATAVKRAVDGRGVAHLVLPDEVQVQPSDAPANGPAGRLGDPG